MAKTLAEQINTASCMYCGDVWAPARFACETV